MSLVVINVRTQDGVVQVRRFIKTAIFGLEDVASIPRNRNAVIHCEDSSEASILITAAKSTNRKQRIVLKVKNIAASRERCLEFQSFNDTTEGSIYRCKEGGSVMKVVGPEHIEFILIELDNRDDLHIPYLEFAEHEIADKDQQSSIDVASSIQNNESENQLSVCKETDPQWSPTIGQRIPNVQPMFLHDGVYRPITVNTPRPIPFRNDIFVGEAILLVNTSHPLRGRSSNVPQEAPSSSSTGELPFHQGRFAGANAKYRFEVQVQGRFLSVPDGQLFIGGEVTRKMELGMVTKGLGISLLQLGRAINPLMHSSFGDKKNVELPHVCGPIWSSVDRLIISDTSAGDLPPELGGILVEEEALRIKRRKNEKSMVIDPALLYTFSVKSSNIDLEHWTACNLPLVTGMDLHTFWGEADLRLVLYYVPLDSSTISTTSALPKLHHQNINKYLFAIEIKHQSNSEVEFEADYSVDARDDVGADRDQMGQIERKQLSRDYDEGLDFFDAEEGYEHDIIQDQNASDSDKNNDDYDGDGYHSDGSNDISHHISKRETFTWGGPAALFTAAGLFNEGEVQREDVGADGKEDDTDGRDSGCSSSDCQSVTRIKQQPISPYLGSPHASLLAPQYCGDKFGSYVCAVVEVEDSRGGRFDAGRRTLYAFYCPAPLRRDDLSGTSTASSKTHPTAILLNVVDDKHTDVDVHQDGTPEGTAEINEAYPFYNSSIVLRSYKEWCAVFPAKRLSKSKDPYDSMVARAFYSRCSEEEKRRINLDRAYQSILADCVHDPKLLQTLSLFLSTGSHTETFLLKTKGPSKGGASVVDSGSKMGGLKGLIQKSPSVHGGGDATKSNRSVQSFELESQACLKLGNAVWSEEHMVLTDHDWIFTKPSKISIPRRDILSAWAVDTSNSLGSQLTAISGIYSFIVETFARQYEVLVRGKENRDTWVDRLAPSLPADIPIMTLSPFGHLHTAGPSSAGAVSLIVRPKNWKHGDRVVLNARSFTAAGYAHLMNSGQPVRADNSEGKPIHSDPVLLCEGLLRLALQCVKYESGDDSDADMDREDDGMTTQQKLLWIEFMNRACLLQAVNYSTVMNLSSAEALAMLLNLYHTMLIHTCLVMGLPKKVFQWQKLFRTCCYEAFGDIFTLAELEHCIIRKDMAKPNINRIAQTVLLPSSEYLFHVNTRDYRLVWAVNNGSFESFTGVPIYTADKINEQLSAVSRYFFQTQIRISGPNTIFLPGLLLWYQKYFETDLNGESIEPSVGAWTGSSQQANKQRPLLHILLRYCGKAEGECITQIIGRNYHIKYDHPNYRCNLLTPLSFEEMEEGS